jgi:hypothetical protein
VERPLITCAERRLDYMRRAPPVKHRHVDVVEVLVEYADAGDADDTPADEEELPSIMG